MTASTLTLVRPDDWHLHLRDGESLRAVVAATARVFARAVVMPNLEPPITTVAAASAYRERIVAALPPGSRFAPLLTLYLTEQTTAEEIVRARRSGFIAGVKYYPAGATTHSESGVRDISRVYSVLEEMQQQNLPLLVHGEATDPEIDIFDRERVFIERVLSRIVRDFPHLRVVLEHASTVEAVDFVTGAAPHVGATITPQHLLWSRNALLAGRIRPHLYCMPVLKREKHRLALLRAATGGSPKFFLGTDSAPHGRHAKESACGCAGCYSAHAALELYAQAFEGADALDRLEGFASFHGPDFYGLPRNRDKVTLRREAWKVPEEYPFGDASVVPLFAGELLHWRVEGASE
jgi:dihydroorotase